MSKQSQAVRNVLARNAQRVQALLAIRAERNATRAAARKHAEGMFQLQQVAAQYGLTLPTTSTVARANSATVDPSRALVTVAGIAYKPCKAVHALCATLPVDATRKQQMELCIDNGINRATASTQIALYRKAVAKIQAMSCVEAGESLLAELEESAE